MTERTGCDDHSEWRDDCLLCVMVKDTIENSTAYEKMGEI